MKRNLGIAFAVVILAFVAGRAFTSTGENTDPQAVPQAMAERLAGCIAEDRFDDLKMAMWECAIDEALVGQLGDQLSLPYKRLCEGLGARTKVERLKAETVSESIARYSFAEFHTRGVVVWQFEFIKPNDEWKLHAYAFGPLRMDGAPSAGPFAP